MLREVVQELLDAYRDLRRHLSRELRNPEEAADIAQSSFERVYHHAAAATGNARDAGIQRPRALLFHTARNLCIDAARRRQTEQAWLAARTAEYADAAAPSAEQVALQRQLLARVTAVLERLPPRRRDVFVLFKVYGYSREEVAQHLDITEAAVAKHVVRATLDCAAAFAELSGEAVLAAPSIPLHSAASHLQPALDHMVNAHAG